MILWRHFARLAPPELRTATEEKVRQGGKALGVQLDVECLRAAAAMFADGSKEQRFAALVLGASHAGAATLQQAPAPADALLAAAQTLQKSAPATIRDLDYRGKPKIYDLNQWQKPLPGASTFATWHGHHARVWTADGTKFTPLKGHKSSVRVATVLADGRIVTGADDKTARVWAADGRFLTELSGHTGAIVSAAGLPDGRVVTGSTDHTARIWAADGQSFIELQGHSDSVLCVAVLADGRVVTGSSDGTARIWAADGQSFTELKGHGGAVTSVAVLADGRVVTGSRDKTARIWAVEGVSFTELKHDYAVFSVTALPNGQVITVVGNQLSDYYGNSGRIWSADGQTSKDLPRIGYLRKMTVLPDGRAVGVTDMLPNILVFSELP